MIAVESPLPLFTCRSTQLYDVDISPSGNQLNEGWETPLGSIFVEIANAREGFLCQ